MWWFLLVSSEIILALFRFKKIIGNGNVKGGSRPAEVSLDGTTFKISRFFGLLKQTVSTLAVHGKYASKVDQDVNNGCKGKTFCDLKPVDYPEEAIDRLVIKYLTLLHRRKRESDLEIPKLEDGSEAGNCKITTEWRTPYELENEGQAPQVIVQSKFFEQKIPYVMCQSTDQPCFKDLIRGGSNTSAKCKQKFISTKLFVYDKNDNQVKVIDGQIPVDCVCEV